MPTPTYIPLATVTLASADSEIVFSSIPATYRDLIVVISGTGSGQFFYGLRFNGDTGSNYSWVIMQDGPDSRSATDPYLLLGWNVNFDTGQTSSITTIMDYAQTDKHKTVLNRSNESGSNVSALAGRWANTTAINSVTALVASGGTFSTGTTFSLYGVN